MLPIDYAAAGPQFPVQLAFLAILLHYSRITTTTRDISTFWSRIRLLADVYCLVVHEAKKRTGRREGSVSGTSKARYKYGNLGWFLTNHPPYLPDNIIASDS